MLHKNWRRLLSTEINAESKSWHGSCGKRLVEVSLSNPPVPAGTPRAGGPGPCLDGFWVTPRMETPSLPWATCACATITLRMPGVQSTEQRARNMPSPPLVRLCLMQPRASSATFGARAHTPANEPQKDMITLCHISHEAAGGIFIFKRILQVLSWCVWPHPLHGSRKWK